MFFDEFLATKDNGMNSTNRFFERGQRLPLIYRFLKHCARHDQLDPDKMPRNIAPDIPNRKGGCGVSLDFGSG